MKSSNHLALALLAALWFGFVGQAMAQLPATTNLPCTVTYNYGPGGTYTFPYYEIHKSDEYDFMGTG